MTVKYVMFHKIMPQLYFMRQYYIKHCHEIKNSVGLNSGSVNVNVIVAPQDCNILAQWGHVTQVIGLITTTLGFLIFKFCIYLLSDHIEWSE